VRRHHGHRETAQLWDTRGWVDDVRDVFIGDIHGLLAVAAGRHCAVCDAQHAASIAVHTAVHSNAPARASERRCATGDVPIETHERHQAAFPLDRQQGLRRRETLPDTAKVETHPVAVECDGSRAAVPADMRPAAALTRLRSA